MEIDLNEEPNKKTEEEIDVKVNPTKVDIDYVVLEALNDNLFNKITRANEGGPVCMIVYGEVVSIGTNYINFRLLERPWELRRLEEYASIICHHNGYSFERGIEDPNTICVAAGESTLPELGHYKADINIELKEYEPKKFRLSYTLS